MIMNCAQCGRVSGEKESDTEGVTSGMCAKCYSVFYMQDEEDKKGLEGILAMYIEKEESGEVVWRGEEKPYSNEDLKTYNDVLSKVRRGYRESSEIGKGNK